MKNPINIKFTDKKEYNDFYQKFTKKILPWLAYRREKAEKPFIRARDESKDSYLIYDLGNEGQIFMDYILEGEKDSYKNLKKAKFKKLSFETQNVPKEVHDKLEDFVLEYYQKDNFEELEKEPSYQM